MEASSNRSRTVGVVIPAFNEAENLPLVLDTVCVAGWLQEIVVVDDGSTDGTLDVIERAAKRDSRVIALRLPENQGKAAAMLAGVRVLHTDLIIFLDADLVGLMPYHLQQLERLQEAGSHEMTIAAFRYGRILTDAAHRFAPHLTGQRCLWRLEAEQALIPLAASRFGVEVGLTIYARRQHWKIQKIIWRGVTHRTKEQKQKIIRGLYYRWQMYAQIMTVIAANGYRTAYGGRNRLHFRAVRRNRLTRH